MKYKTTTLIVICSFLFFASITLVAQTHNKNSRLYNNAISFSEEGDYKQAIGLFKKIAEEDPDNINVLYNLGYCYLNTSNGPDSSEIYLNKALDLLGDENYGTDLGVDLHLSLGKCNQLLYKFEDAIKYYEFVLDFIDDDQVELRREIDREIETSKNGIVLMKNPVKLKVHNLGRQVNSKYDDHSPLVSADESVLLFTSRRMLPRAERMPDGQFSEKIFQTRFKDGRWSEAKLVTSLMDMESHESGVCLSADGAELYLLRSDFNGQDLYVSEFRDSTWGEPVKLPEGINSRYQETHASINADKSVLFFTSDRKGGYGGLDIYMVRKLPNDTWGIPQNLGSNINSIYDEETPMIHPDGNTLYFSSEGHNSMGKFDIFYCQMNADSSWNKPVNMGYPINTPDDDFFFVPTAAKNRAYMASSRFDHNFGGSDLYLIEYEEPENERLAVIKGRLQSNSNEGWEDIRILVKEKNKDELVGEYRLNPSTGAYVMILEVDKTYNVHIEGPDYEKKDTILAVTKNMTYFNKQQNVKMNDIWINSVIKTPSKEDIAKIDRDFTVQFITLKKVLKNLDQFGLNSKKIKIHECKDGNVRYVYGQFDTYKEAKIAKEKVMDITGYSDPFVRYFWQLNKLKEEGSAK